MHIELEWLQAAIRAHKGDAPIMAMLEAVAPLIRDAVLEEAAKISDDAGDCIDGADISDAIRALKTKETGNDANA